LKYDFLIVGAGLFGAVFAYEAGRRGKRCLVIDRREHVGGNIYTEAVAGIQVHRYGAHIFHTDDKDVWDYMNRFAAFNRFTNSPLAIYRDELYNLPYNMNTFYRLWGTVRPEQAKAKIKEQTAAAGITEPRNLEEQGISLVGRELYEKLIKGYTEKQWGKPATELPASIIRRVPVRFTYDNNYFGDPYQGIPQGGYTQIVEQMLSGADIELGRDFFADRALYLRAARTVLFTGRIDRYYDCCYGALGYRSLRFEQEVLPCDNYQGNAVINYTDYDVPYTRIIEHKHFEFATPYTPHTVITREYPAPWQPDMDPYYPLCDSENLALYARYRALADEDRQVIFGGRLGEYRYYDMHQVVKASLALVARLFGN